MRSLTIALVAVAVLVAAPARAESPSIGDKPWTTGLLLGVSTWTANSATQAFFALEIPVEYGFKVGPGYLAPHFGFALGATKGCTTIALPMGVRYKIPVAAFPLYVYPMLDIGPGFVIVDGAAAAGGVLRVGGGLSYLVHPNVELVFQPLGLGATFDANGGQFMWNFLTGVQAHF
jgi:hypothetical protein